MDAVQVRTFEEFVERSSHALYRTAYLLSGDPHLAQDLLQAALERVCRRWAGVSGMDHPEAYVRRTMINLTTDRWRRRRYVVEVPLDEAGSAGVGDPTRLLDLRGALVQGLLTLPPGMRAAVVLRYWEGLSESEAARQLGCSVGSVKSQSSRGLSRLRTLVTDPERSGVGPL